MNRVNKFKVRGDHEVEVVIRPSSEKRKARESQRPMFGGPESIIGERVQKDLDYYFLGKIFELGCVMSDDNPRIQWSATEIVGIGIDNPERVRKTKDGKTVLMPTTFTIKFSPKVTTEDLLNDDPIFPFTTRPSEVAEEITETEDERVLATALEKPDCPSIVDDLSRVVAAIRTAATVLNAVGGEE